MGNYWVSIVGGTKAGKPVKGKRRDPKAPAPRDQQPANAPKSKRLMDRLAAMIPHEFPFYDRQAATAIALEESPRVPAQPTPGTI